jgi:hypothetical protein
MKKNKRAVGRYRDYGAPVSREGFQPFADIARLVIVSIARVSLSVFYHRERSDSPRLRGNKECGAKRYRIPPSASEAIFGGQF